MTATEKFTFKAPVFTEFTPASKYELGDEIVLNGTNLDLVTGVKWGDYDLSVKEEGRTPESITVGIPTNIPQAEPVDVTAALKAYFGQPEREIAVAEAMTVNTTAKGPDAPVFTSIAPTDENYDKLYLDREVTVKGENMASIEKFILASEEDGEVEALVAGTPDDYSAAFVMPKNIKGTAKKTMTLTAVWNGGNRTDFGPIEVYPFYYTKGLKIGVGSNSSSTYSDFARENAFLMLDEGKVISVKDWVENKIDRFALEKSNPIMSDKSKLAAEATEEQYYGVSPYIILTTSSSNKLAFQNPANSNSQLKTHRYPESTSISSTFGSPIVFYKVVDDAEVKNSVVNTALEAIDAYSEDGGASAPAFGTKEDDTWIKGSVLTVQYATYEHGHGTGGKITDRSQVCKMGYIYIRDVTCADEATGQTNADREGWVEFDLYWSNVLE